MADNMGLLLKKNIVPLMADRRGASRRQRCLPLAVGLLVGIFCLGFFPGQSLAGNQGYPGQEIVEMSQVLKEKEQALDAREKLLAEKERRLQLLQEELARKEQEIAAMERRAEKILAEIKAAKEEDLSRLVSVFSTMKPAAAAPLVAKLEQQYAVEVILRMEPRKAGKILAAMEPEQAATISRLITSMPAKTGEKE